MIRGMGALKPGYDVTSDIALVRRLGAGGMGTVWLARHRKLQSEVVVKFLSESLTSDEDACARFSREVVATIQVRSPHVVQTLDHGVTEGGVPYIVMELLEGQDLAKVLRARGYLRPDEVQHIVGGVAAALSKAHERGIVHRDIKPANVFMCSASPRPFVKLVDFGIAKRLEDETMTATNALLGTPAYMSPEQMGGLGAVDHRSDLWALGVLAFHCLTGAVPFRGAHIANIAHAILNESTPRATQIRPDLPPAVDAWIERALAREPGDRFASAQEMAETLAMALGDLAHLTTSRLLQVGSGSNLGLAPQPPAEVGLRPASHPFAKPSTGRNLTGPVRPPLSGPMLMPSPSSPPSGPMAFDGVGATLGPSAITHSPYLSSPRFKWWVMGAAAAAVVLIGGAFRVGYGLRREEPVFPPAAELPPPLPAATVIPTATVWPTATVLPTAELITAPTQAAPAPTPTIGVIAPPPPTALPSVPVPTARSTASPARKPPRAATGKKGGRVDDDDVGF